MKNTRKILVLLLTLVMALGMMQSAFAADNTVSWDGKNVSAAGNSLGDTISGLQPGDEATFSIAIANNGTEKTDWYMTNGVETLEANSTAAGGAYHYELVYVGKDGTETLISSSVGGESTVGGQGLEQATNTTGDYFFLDTLEPGESGVVTLTVSLDGETQGNDYMNTMGTLELDFGVEPTPTDTTTTVTKELIVTKTVQTNDSANLTLPMVLMSVCGVVLVVLAVFSFRKDRKEREAK